MYNVIECTNIPKDKLITIIRPIRVDADTEYLLSRVDNHINDKYISDTVGFIVVDDGSSREYCHNIKRICLESNIGYIHIDSELDKFSPSRARNIGSIYASSKYIFMQDIDLYPYDNFYNNLIEQIIIQDLDSDITRFIMVPCIYLNTEGLQVLNDGSAINKNILLNDAILGNDRYIERISTGTSSCVFNREHFLRSGGYYEEFSGWGYEDLELNCRMIRKSKDFPTPRDWSLERFNFNTIYEYSGWKSVYRLYGDICFYHGIVLFHGTHKIKQDLLREVQRKKNYQFFIDNLKNLKDPDPLPDIYCGNTLVMKKCIFTMNPDIISWYGHVYIKDDYGLETLEEIIDFIEQKNINRIVFFNPYSNQLNIDLYRYVRKYDIEYIICERGALPGTFFFDKNGFLADSSSYHESNWARELNNDEKCNILKYIQNLFSSENTLEKQGSKKTVQEIRKKFNIGHKKVIFVPFQRPHDTAVEFFSRKNTYDDFIDIIRELSKTISKDYILMVKRHPLEDKDFEIENVTYVNDIHINVLVEISDFIVTFTSGVGLLGIAAGKPVFTIGSSFYSHEGFSWNVDSYQELIDLIYKNVRPDRERALAFLYYLIYKFYSIGQFVTRDVTMEDGKRMTATIGIKNNIIRYKDKETIFYVDKKPRYSWSALLFDRYRFSENIFAKNKNLVKEKNVKENITKELSSIKRVQKENISQKETTHQDVVMRKFRKLLRSPIQFFKDIRWLK